MIQATTSQLRYINAVSLQASFIESVKERSGEIKEDNSASCDNGRNVKMAGNCI